MSQEAAATRMGLTNICRFFRLPNPRILTLFIISSTTSFSLGIAMIVQWVLHGQYHQGFHWMIYGGSAITSLPVLIWFIFMLFAICSVSHHTSPSSSNDAISKSQQTLTRDQQYTDTEAATAITTTTQDEAALAAKVVQTEIINDQPAAVRKSPMPVSQPTPRKRTDDNKQALKRTLSLPLFHVHTEYFGNGGTNYRRSRSLKQ